MEADYREKIGTLRRESGSLLRYDPAVYLGVLSVSGPEMDGVLEFRSRGIIFGNAASKHLIYIPAGEIADAMAPGEGMLMIEQTTESGAKKHAFRIADAAMVAVGAKKLRDDSRKAAAPDEDVFTRIRKLAELREAGALTEAEFSAKKTELLKDI